MGWVFAIVFGTKNYKVNEMATVNKIVVFNETLNLGDEIEVSEVRANLASFVRDHSIPLSERMAESDYEVRHEGDSLVVYRNDVHFG